MSNGLTPQQVHEIRMSMETDTTIAKRCGRSQSAISRFRTGRSGAPLTSEEWEACLARHAARSERVTFRCGSGDLIGVGDPYHPWGAPLFGVSRMGLRDAAMECPHGRLPGDLTAPCGCWVEDATVVALPLRGVAFTSGESLTRAA